MKNIQRILAIALLLSFSACEVTNPDIIVGGDGDADLGGNQYANIEFAGTINFLFQTTDEITIDFEKFEAEGTTISSIDVTKSLFIEDVKEDDGDTLTSVTTSSVTYNATGSSFTQTLDELFADVLVNGVLYTEDSLDPGDSWTFSYVLNIDGNAPSADNKLVISTSTNVPFSCVSEIPLGEYTASQSDAGWFGGSTTKTVMISAGDDPGTYLISDVSAGGYELCCGGFGYNPDQPAVVTDICNIVKVSGDGGSQISSGQAPSMAGSWDPVTQTMVVNYTDEFNGGQELTSTFVKD